MAIQLQNSTLDALLQRLSAGLAEDGSFCELTLSLDDASTASSDISSGDEVQEDDEGKVPSKPYNHLRNTFGKYPEHSWTVHFFERNRQAGDSIWFRAWRNDKHDFVEMEDDEILSFIESNIHCEPNSRFYLKMTQRGGFTSVVVLDATLIVRALKRILDIAQERDRLYVPSKEWLEKAILREERAKRGFFPWLRPGRP